MKMKKRVIRAMLLLLIAAMVASFACACAPSPSEDPEEDVGPKFVAHRGYSVSYVDNTEEAFLAAANLGFYGIETDIRKTKDGYFVCNHDADVQYKNGTKRISEYDLSVLLSEPLKNHKTENDVYLCTFESYLRACKSGNKVAVIELKDYFTTQEVLKMLDVIDAEYDREMVSFISFSYPTLKSVRKADPFVDLQYLSQESGDAIFSNCLREMISIDVSFDVLTEELVETFHDQGLTVNVWTVDNESDVETATELGVDYITTNVFYKR